MWDAGEHWAGKAHESSDNRGKLLRRDGFTLAQERYGRRIFASHRPVRAHVVTDAYKPILEEVEKILAEAGLDEEEIKRGAVIGQQGATGQSRNRR